MDKMRKKITGWFAISQILCCAILNAQGVTIEGYTFEIGNRGYLSQVNITLTDSESGQEFYNSMSEISGHFKTDVPPVKKIKLKANKQAFKDYEKLIDLSEARDGKIFLKIEMERKSGYFFEITLANKRNFSEEKTDAIKGALIEVYNNTTNKEILKLENHQEPEFNVYLEKGNHYTILVRNEGYIAKLMEVFVNVKGCILCFEGVSDVKPGVTENLTSGNDYGVLLANVELEKVKLNEPIPIHNIKYASGSDELTDAAKKELDKVFQMVRYNPQYYFELSSHTDCIGSNILNQELSKRRANKALNYIQSKTSLPSDRIIANGYGEEQPKNHCKDGVYCKETEHAENRRTELLIYKIESFSLLKPLVNIKEEERFDAELMSGQNQEISEEEFEKLQIKGGLNPTINDEIKDKNSINAKDPKVSEKDNDIEHLQTKKGERDHNTDKEIPEKVIATNEKEKTTQIVTQNDMPSDPIVEVSNTKQTTIADGYYIVVYYSTKPLSKQNAIFSAEDNVIEFKAGDRKYLYLADKHEDEQSANVALNQKYAERFPGAYIIQFRNNTRVK
jgi:flagellar motor protein MotB